MSQLNRPFDCLRRTVVAASAERSRPCAHVAARTNGKRPEAGRNRNTTCSYERSAYWLNNLRVAGEPAGMPACSSFAYSVISCFSMASSADSGNGRR